MDRNDSDIFTNGNRKTWLSDMCYESYLANGSHSAVKKMAGSSHTPASCLVKLSSSLETGKKQLRVWLQYVCSVVEVLLYPSYGAPLVIRRWLVMGLKMARNGALLTTHVQVSTKRAS